MKRYILLLFTFFAILCAVAQTAQVKSFRPAMSDLTAQKYSRNDNNGVKCAVVKVQVIAANVQFQGGIIEPVEKKPGEYWVYMPQSEQRVLVMSDDFKPLMVEFPDPLQAGVTYVLDLETPQRAGDAQPQKPQMSFLVLKVQPALATVRIDGAAMTGEDGVVSKMLANGVHSYSVEAPGYATEEGTVTLDGHRMERTITLRSTKPTLTVTAVTPGTEIYVNESLKGTGSWTGELFADSYMVEGRKTGYRPVSEMVTLAEGEKRTVSLPALAAITGSLSIDYKPVGAKITIDGKQAGITPDLINDLLVGPHTVAISADGYETATLTAQISESDITTLTGSLPSAPAIVEGEEIYYDYAPFLAENGKWGYKYKYNGEVVIPAKYDKTDYFCEGLAQVLLNGKWGYIDKSGELAIPAKYDWADDFSEELSVAMVQLNGKWGYIDKSGNMVIPAKYDDVSSFREGFAMVKLDGKYGFFNKDGNMIASAQYDDARDFCEGLAAVKLNNKWGYIDNSGRVVIPAKYEDAGYFSEGLTWVMINGKLGCIDKMGNMLIPAKYDWASKFCNGKAEVKLNGRTFYIDKNGNEVK